MDARVKDPAETGGDALLPVVGLAAKVVSRLINRDGPGSAVVRPDLLQRLTDVILSADPAWIVTLFADLRRAGVTKVAFADRYLPEIARKLGKCWEDDTLGFAEVTMGTSRLQAIMREIGKGWSADHDLAPVKGAATALLIIPRDEQHTLGGLVLLGHLRRRGVSVALRIGPGAAELRDLLSERHFDAALISVGQQSGVESCRKLVKTLRDLTGGRIRVAVGGAALGLVTDLRGQTGADIASNDVSAVIQALGLEHVGGGPIMMHETVHKRE